VVWVLRDGLGEKPAVIEIEEGFIACKQCRLIYMAVERLHCECPICGFPFRQLLPGVEMYPRQWLRRPQG